MSIDTINARIAKLERDKERMLRLAEAEREVAELRSQVGEDDELDALPENIADAAVDSEDLLEEPETSSPARARVLAIATRFVPRRKRSIAAVITAALVVPAGAIVGVLALSSDNGLPRGVAFQVAGRNITQSQLDAEIQTLQALYGITPPTSAKELDTFRRSAAKAYAVSLVLDREAQSRHIVIADKQAQDVLARYLQQQYGNSSDAVTQFDAALGQVGTSEQAVLTEIKRQLAITQLFNQVSAGVQVNDAQVAAYFAKNSAAMATPEQRDIHNIVVQTQATAESLMTQLTHGRSFDPLAKTYSLDASTNKSGGDLGVVQATDLDAAYAKVAFGATQGVAFGPIKTQYGWNIGEVTKIVPSSPAVFSKVKSALHDQMVADRQLTRWRTWLDGEIPKAHVRYAPAYRPSDPNAAPSGQPGSPQVATASSTQSH